MIKVRVFWRDFAIQIPVGIIAALKACYRRLFLQHIIRELEKRISSFRADGQSPPPDLAATVTKEFTLLDCVRLLTQARAYLRENPDIIVNCWRKAGFTSSAPSVGPTSGSSLIFQPLTSTVSIIQQQSESQSGEGGHEAASSNVNVAPPSHLAALEMVRAMTVGCV